MDLHVFCHLHFDTPHTHVICAALRRFIDSELKADDKFKARFDEAKKSLELTGSKKSKLEPIRLVDSGPTSTGRSES